MFCDYCIIFFFNDTATTEIYTYGHTLSLHDALPICAIYSDKRGAGKPGQMAYDREKWRNTLILGGYPQNLWIILCVTCRVRTIQWAWRFNGNLSSFSEFLIYSFFSMAYSEIG